MLQLFQTRPINNIELPKDWGNLCLVCSSQTHNLKDCALTFIACVNYKGPTCSEKTNYLKVNSQQLSMGYSKQITYLNLIWDT